MGLLEKIDHKLTLICLALNIALDTDASQIIEQVAAKFAPVESAVIPVVAATTPEAVTAAMLGTAVVPPAPAGTVRVTVKQALAAGAKLTGQELDEQGCYWDKDINTNVPAVTQKNIWKRGKNVDEVVYDNRIAQIKADVAATGSAPANVAPITPAPAATLPLPGVTPPPPAATLPLPGVGAVHQSSLEDPIRKEIIASISLLTNKYEVDYSVIGVMLAEHGAKESNFVTLPDASYPAVAKKLNQWMQAYDLVDEADQAVRGMNGNDPTYLLTLMGQLQLGTNELATVQHTDYYRLYQNIHAYQNQLEAHFQKPLTGIKPDPFKA